MSYAYAQQQRTWGSAKKLEQLRQAQASGTSNHLVKTRVTMGLNSTHGLKKIADAHNVDKLLQEVSNH